MASKAWKPTTEQVMQGISYLRGCFKVALQNDHIVAQKAALRAVLESGIDRSSPLMKEAYAKYADMKKRSVKKGVKKRVIKSSPKAESIDDVINLSMADVVNKVGEREEQRSKPNPGESMSDYVKRIKKG